MKYVDITQDAKVYRTVPREVERKMIIEIDNFTTEVKYVKKTVRKDKISFKSKEYVEKLRER